MRKLAISAMVLLFAGCSTGKWMTSGKLAPPYTEEPILTTSLFASDQSVLDDDAINAILTGRIVIPSNAKIAIIKFPSPQEQRRFGYYYSSLYWQSEEYQNAQERFYETLETPLLQSDRTSEVVLLPSLLVPEKASIPILREAAVRTQADLLLVYMTNSNYYEKYRIFKSNKIKAYCTCEAVLLDIRTGIIPFTYIVTETFEGQKEKEDMDDWEMRQRAENEATVKALAEMSNKLVAFLESLPQ